MALRTPHNRIGTVRKPSVDLSDNVLVHRSQLSQSVSSSMAEVGSMSVASPPPSTPKTLRSTLQTR
jgi:hypothetical protein